MQIEFITSGEIENQNGKFNIENRDFLFQVLFTPTGQNVFHIFSLEDQPGDLEIDPISGLITGNLLSLEDNGEDSSEASYPEYDFREYKELRGSKNEFQFDFTIKVNGEEYVGSSTASFEGETDVTIKIIKDCSVNLLLHQKTFLDGKGNREPFTCTFQVPSTEEECSYIGGEWDNENNECNINIPRNESDCTQIGAKWENSKCNISMISDKTKCTKQGYEWKKNSQNGHSSYQDFSEDFEEETLEIQDNLI